MRVTLQMAREELADLPNANLCVDDPRIDTLINRCQRRIIEKSRSDLLHRRIRICVSNKCIVTPRGIVTLTDAAIGTVPIPVRNGWYEFLPNQSGVDDGKSNCVPVGLHYRQEVCTIRNIPVTASTIKIYTEQEEAADSYVTIYGFDQYERKVRTDWDLDGEPEDGERISIAGPATVFTGTVAWGGGGISNLVKSSTRGRVLVYSVDPTTTAETLIGVYDDDETNPSYKEYLLRGEQIPDDENPLTFTAMAKMEFIPAKNPDDVLIVPSLEAIRLMAEAVLKMDNNQFAEGVGISREAMRHFGEVRDHNMPIEQIAVSMRSQGTARLNKRRIGRII